MQGEYSPQVIAFGSGNDTLWVWFDLITIENYGPPQRLYIFLKRGANRIRVSSGWEYPIMIASREHPMSAYSGDNIYLRHVCVNVVVWVRIYGIIIYGIIQDENCIIHITCEIVIWYWMGIDLNKLVWIITYNPYTWCESYEWYESWECYMILIDRWLK